MYRVKIYGAGSIGNHLANAARRLEWQVDLCDVDRAALDRTRTSIYPSRYGKWDASIGLYEVKEAPRGKYDFVFVGTPPEHHIPLAIEALAEEPRLILMEKPVCPPSLERAQELFELVSRSRTRVCVGYDHVVGRAATRFLEVIGGGSLGRIQTIDVEFREHWGGIFQAHPWLEGPADTYLGYWRRGGGAGGEHSHAINFWQHLAHAIGAGRVVELNSMLQYEGDGRVDYDSLCALNLRTESGLAGRVVQDVVTSPPRKWARVQGSEGFAEWHAGFRPGSDAVRYSNGPEVVEEIIQKSRPDDFIWELEHLRDLIEGRIQQSGISLERGLDSMLVVAGAHASAERRANIAIDYARGYQAEALRTVDQAGGRSDVRGQV